MPLLPPPFRPTRAQRRFALVLAATPVCSSITALCVEAGVHRASYHRWCHDPAFRDWLMDQWSPLAMLGSLRQIQYGRAHAGESLPHLRMLVQLLFDPRGLAAVAASVSTSGLQSPIPSPQSLAGQNATFFQTSRALNPGQAMRFFTRVTARAPHPSAPHRHPPRLGLTARAANP